MDVSLELHPPAAVEERSIVWDAQVGSIEEWDPPWSMLLGQVGFFDKFTITMSRAANLLAVEPLETWDQRFP